jgi:hypothetical protein
MFKRIYLHFAVKGAVLGVIISTVVWAILTVSVFPFVGNEKLMLTVGALLWGVVWFAIGAMIGVLGVRFHHWKALGASCGAVIGTISGILLIVWPQCSEAELFQWALRSAIDLPISSVLFFLNTKVLHIFGTSFEPRGNLESFTIIVSSIVLWSTFGMLIGLLVRKKYTASKLT